MEPQIRPELLSRHYPRLLQLGTLLITAVGFLVLSRPEIIKPEPQWWLAILLLIPELAIYALLVWRRGTFAQSRGAGGLHLLLLLFGRGCLGLFFALLVSGVNTVGALHDAVLQSFSFLWMIFFEIGAVVMLYWLQQIVAESVLVGGSSAFPVQHAEPRWPEASPMTVTIPRADSVPARGNAPVAPEVNLKQGRPMPPVMAQPVQRTSHWDKLQDLPSSFEELEQRVRKMPDLHWMVVYDREGLVVASTVTDVRERDGRAALLADLLPVSGTLLTRIADGEQSGITLTSHYRTVRISPVTSVFVAFSLSDTNSLEAADQFIILSVDRIWKAHYSRSNIRLGA